MHFIIQWTQSKGPRKGACWQERTPSYDKAEQILLKCFRNKQEAKVFLVDEDNNRELIGQANWGGLPQGDGFTYYLEDLEFATEGRVSNDN